MGVNRGNEAKVKGQAPTGEGAKCWPIAAFINAFSKAQWKNTTQGKMSKRIKGRYTPESSRRAS